MGTFRKKPVVVEAFQWFTEMGATGGVMRDGNREGLQPRGHGHFPAKLYCIRTLEGGHQVIDGDWIITGVKGEKYPCKPDIFNQTYEEVTDAVHTTRKTPRTIPPD